MNKYEETYCPRCNAVFECKPDNIAQCRCYGVALSDDEKRLIEKDFTGCLCYDCLLAIKKEFVVQPKQLPLRKLK